MASFPSKSSSFSSSCSIVRKSSALGERALRIDTRARYAASPDQFLIVFKMFDLDGSGKLDYSEFQQVIRAQGGQQPVDATPGKIAIPGGILSQWFGPDGSKSFSLEQFVRFLEDLQASILRAQISAHCAFLLFRSFVLSVVHTFVVPL